MGRPPSKPKEPEFDQYGGETHREPTFALPSSKTAGTFEIHKHPDYDLVLVEDRRIADIPVSRDVAYYEAYEGFSVVDIPAKFQKAPKVIIYEDGSRQTVHAEQVIMARHRKVREEREAKRVADYKKDNYLSEGEFLEKQVSAFGASRISSDPERLSPSTLKQNEMEMRQAASHLLNNREYAEALSQAEEKIAELGD